MVDIQKALKDVVKKGMVHIGEKRTKAAITNDTAKLIVIAKNCPYASDLLTHATEKKIPTYTYTGSSVDLGTTCGKGYAVSSFAVINEGDSNIMQLISKRT
jgi:large subunit ribosomal protein L30e